MKDLTMDSKMEQDALQIIISIKESLATLNARMEQVLSTMSNHEMRLSKLEENKTSLKDSIIALLVKGLVGAILVIATLTGSAELISKILGL